MSEDAGPSVATQAATVRDCAAREEDPRRRAALEAAARTLQYHSERPAIMRACAYFEKNAPWSMEFFNTFPDARFSAVGEHGELSGDG